VKARALAVIAVLSACSAPPRPDVVVAGDPPAPPPVGATLPRAPDQFAPSLLRVNGAVPAGFGDTLADVDTCASCHPDVAAQWNASAHSFASFGNPIYRQNVELARHELGKDTSQHCGGCHDIPLEVDGTMRADIPPADLRAHSGVTCRACHGIDAVSPDGNGSYVLRAQPIETPDLHDPASIERHKKSASLRSLGADVCNSCHRGFLSPDMGPNMPVHISGLDEPTAWKSSAYTGNGAGRIDQVEQRTCLDCHMANEPASKDELAAHDGVVMSHRFLGGHTWMAGMRGDADEVARLQAHLKGVASIDVAAVIEPRGAAAPAEAPHTASGAWILPADGAPVTPGSSIGLEVVVRNLLVGHRFPGGVMDMQDTWIEVDVTDARGARVASSGLAHETDADDPDAEGGAHVLRSFPVDANGDPLDLHQMPSFRAIAAVQTIAPRDATVVRYQLDVPRGVALPLHVSARLRHRSRSLREQEVVCDDARTPAGRAFFAGAQGARDVTLDPCAPQPVTEIAATSIVIGGASPASPRAAWERDYELGMALVGEVGEKLDEARVVLEAARAITPAGADGDRPRAMIDAQLAWVAGKQGRTDDALALVARAKTLLPKAPPVLDAIAADALSRVWRWQEAIAPAEAAAKKAPLNTQRWVVLAQVLASAGDDRGALAAARAGLAISPRDPDLLRSQATALRAIGSPLADAALAAFERFRQPDDAAELRIACASRSPRCERERETGHIHELVAPR
jgi:hypothetical protein